MHSVFSSVISMGAGDINNLPAPHGMFCLFFSFLHVKQIPEISYFAKIIFLLISKLLIRKPS